MKEIDLKELFSLIGKETGSAEVREAIKALKPKIKNDPPDGRCYSVEDKGITLLEADGKIKAVQIFVQPDKPFAAYPGPLPFGLAREMTQDKVHAKLGTPAKATDLRSQFELQGSRLTVWYDAEKKWIRYINIGLPRTAKER